RKTPYELFYGIKPDVSHLRTYGSNYWMLNERDRQGKLDSKAIPVIIAGYSWKSKGYRFFDPRTLKISETRNLIVDEGNFDRTDFHKIEGGPSHSYVHINPFRELGNSDEEPYKLTTRITSESQNEQTVGEMEQD